MALTDCEYNQEAVSTKVIIPKGMVNPNETTVIEIPNTLKNTETVVARPKGNLSKTTASRSMSPAGQQLSKSAYTRRTYPKPPPSPDKDCSCPDGQDATQERLSKYLTSVEASEMCKMQSSIKNYQLARRKLTEEAANLATPAEISKNFLGK